MAEPPAESPSTIKSSVPSWLEFWQSANFPGKPVSSSAPFLRTVSRAFLATSLAWAAWIILASITFAIDGFWSNHKESLSLMIVSTIFLTCEETSLSFVCDENLGSGILIDITQV